MIGKFSRDMFAGLHGNTLACIATRRPDNKLGKCPVMNIYNCVVAPHIGPNITENLHMYCEAAEVGLRTSYRTLPRRHGNM